MRYARMFATTLFGLFALDAARNWYQWTFTPDVAMEFFQVSAETLWGLNMLKTDMTGGVAASGVFAFMYLIQGKKWLPPAIAIVSVFLVTRLIHMAVDGHEPMLWAGIAYEGVYFATGLFLLKTDPYQ